ncbi:MAG: hypothetical protein JWM21_1277 [Acidobacteria bacterium]|nr:hypothetical protein [Acidobacteriota bacterium]
MLSSRQELRKKRTLVVLSVVVLLGLIIISIAVSPPATRARTLLNPIAGSANKQQIPAYVPGQILVRYQSDAAAKRQQTVTTTLSTEGRTIPVQVKRFGGSDLIPGLRLAYVAPDDTLKGIEAFRVQPDVLYAEPDYLTKTDLTPNDTNFGSLYGLTKIDAPTAWNTTTGSNNIVVGVVDEGVDIVHEDLQANIYTNPAPGSISGISGDLHGYDFVHNSGTIPAENHGTHVSGIIGAVGNNGKGVVGVNWQVKLMPLKAIGQGAGLSAVIAACSYAKQMKDLFVSSGGTQGANLRVLNNSWSQVASEGFSQPLFDSITALNQAGILFVAAAGNFPEDPGIDNDLNPFYPAGYAVPNVIAVASTDQTDTLYSGSHYGGNTVHLGAPGVGILSTTPGDHYDPQTGTSMATPHVSGAAALLLAANQNLTVQQLKNALLLNGDVIASLSGKTITGRRLNVSRSLNSLSENDVTAPGTVTNFQVTSQTGRNLTLSWTPSGDDGTTGQASLYQVSFTDRNTNVVIPLKNVVPSLSGTPQSVSVKLPYAHTRGTLTLREFDNVGNEGVPATTSVSISFADGDPYAKTLGPNALLSTGGTHLNFNCDDCFKTVNLPFSFSFFGQAFTSVKISSNGNLYFPPPNPPTRGNGDADDATPAVKGPISLASFRMISGLWDDLYLGTDQRADADVYMVQPDANTVIFRWQAVPFNIGNFGAPVNFEVELRSNGLIQSRYGSGNTGLFPVVGISVGEVDPYVVTSHTSEHTPRNLTNAQTVTYIPRDVINPMDNANFFVSQHYRDFLSREPDAGGLNFWIEQITGNASNTPAPCAPGDSACINARRIGVSDAFFVELEYQQTGSYVYRVYRAAFGNNQPFPNPHPDGAFPGEDLKMPNYPVFAADRALVIGGSNLAQLQLNYANAFVLRPEFIAKYPASLATADQFVDAMLTTMQNDIGVNLTGERSNLITLYNSGGRGAVVYRLADDNVGTNPINNRAFIDAEYNRAFVFGEYSGYLRRNSDIPGFMFWLGQVNAGPLRDIGKQHAMVCSFITSSEYQQRFSALVTHNNTECQ